MRTPYTMQDPTKSADFEAEVSKKTIASIINHMIRVFHLPEANVPTKVCVSKNMAYDFTEETLTYGIKANLLANSEPFEPWITVLWKDIQKTKPKGYKYKWDVSNNEKDHMIEVQHVIKMLIYAKRITETGWSTLPLATVVHLGYYLNDQRNLWSIPKAFNQAKAWIPLSCWYGDKRPSYIDPRKSSTEWEKLQCRIAKEYLFAFCTKDGRTPFSQLLSLAAEMAGLQINTMTWLTVRAGEQILALLESWTGQVTGIEKEDLEKTKIVYNLASAVPIDKWTKKRQLLHERAKKGLALFASDVAHTATTMNWTVAIQTDPLPTDSQISIEEDGPDDFVDDGMQIG